MSLFLNGGGCVLPGSIEGLVREAMELLAVSKGQHCLVGGLAITLRSSERTTKDVDLAVAVLNDTHAEEILRIFIHRGFTLSALLENKRHNRISTARLVREEEGTIIDLLFSTCGIETEIVERATSLEIFPTVLIPVATIPSLLAMKILSADLDTRMQDILDIKGMLGQITTEELAEARKLLELIQQRGYSRDKDLFAELAKYLQKYGSTK